MSGATGNYHQQTSGLPIAKWVSLEDLLKPPSVLPVHLQVGHFPGKRELTVSDRLTTAYETL